MRFSLVLATRNRISLFTSFLESILKTTKNKSDIEVIAVYDTDDESIKEVIPENFNEINLRLISRVRSKRLNEDYINFAARQSSGEFIFILNDDVEFRTQDWDEIAYNKLKNAFSDGICYAATDDGLRDLKNRQRIEYACFPIISRKAFDVLGYAMNPIFPSWGADVHLIRVYEKAKRVIDLSEIKVTHISYHANLREKDEINLNSEILSRGTIDPMKVDIHSDYLKLTSLTENKTYITTTHFDDNSYNAKTQKRINQLMKGKNATNSNGVSNRN